MEKTQDRDIAGLICSGRKDYHILHLAVARLWRLSPVGHIYVVTEDMEDIPGLEPVMEKGFVSRHTDAEVLPKPVPELDGSRRRGWFVQQFVKLVNTVRKERWQLVVDADTMLTGWYNPFSDSGKPRWLHNPKASPIGDKHYKAFNEKIFGLEMSYPYRFVSEVCFYDGRRLDRMVKQAGCADGGEFIDKACEIINTPGVGIPAESETYMGYVYSTEPKAYHLEKNRFLGLGKYEHKGDVWDPSEVEVKSTAEEVEGKYLYVAFHQWL